jgi:small-conductance mechanosensitive channel
VTYTLAVLAPIDYSRVETALATPHGWVELAIVAVCFAIGWAVDRRVRLRAEKRPEIVRLGLGGFNRLVLPLTTLVLLVIAHAAFRRFFPPFFLSIALPLVVALAVIRLVVYALRGVFGNAAWMKTSERAIAFTVWVGALLYFIGVLPQIRDELEGIKLPIGKPPISVYDVLESIAVVVVTVAITLWLSGLVERRLMRAAHLEMNFRVLLGRLIRAVLLALGVLIALRAIGFDLTLLSVFGGALGVGIGLGLQRFAANYIAGFTILLDRSVRLGDLITVEERTGTVAKVTSRYVVVRGGDGVEAIVPNESLTTKVVLNHHSPATTSDMRVAVNVTVSYDSDVERALRIMEELALAEPRVIKTANTPQAFLARFGDNGIELELGVWIRDPENGQLNLKSSLNRAILRAFAESGLRIASPQREFRLVGQWPPQEQAASSTPPPPAPTGARPESARPPTTGTAGS